MSMWDCIRKMNRRNAGSALVSVIVVIAFISILATTMLYISGINFRMKVIDFKTKESFYDSEIITERFRSALIQDTTKAIETAYQEVSLDFVVLSTAEARETRFRECFKDAFQEVWDNRWSGSNEAEKVKNGIASIFDISASDVSYDSSVCSFRFDGLTVEINSDTFLGTTEAFLYDQSLRWMSANTVSDPSAPPATPTDSASYIAATGSWYQDYYRIRNFNCVVTNGADYSSVIKTSYYVVSPDFKWGAENTSAELIKNINFDECVDYINWSKE